MRKLLLAGVVALLSLGVAHADATVDLDRPLLAKPHALICFTPEGLRSAVAIVEKTGSISKAALSENGCDNVGNGPVKIVSKGDRIVVTINAAMPHAATSHDFYSLSSMLENTSKPVEPPPPQPQIPTDTNDWYIINGGLCAPLNIYGVATPKDFIQLLNKVSLPGAITDLGYRSIQPDEQDHSARGQLGDIKGKLIITIFLRGTTASEWCQPGFDIPGQHLPPH